MAKTIDKLNLASEHLKAIDKLSLMFKEQFPVIDIVMFGSTARGEAREGSDLGLLIITSYYIWKSAACDYEQNVRLGF